MIRACFFVRDASVFESEDKGEGTDRHVNIHVNLEQHLSYVFSLDSIYTRDKRMKAVFISHTITITLN